MTGRGRADRVPLMNEGRSTADRRTMLERKRARHPRRKSTARTSPRKAIPSTHRGACGIKSCDRRPGTPLKKRSYPRSLLFMLLAAASVVVAIGCTPQAKSAERLWADLVRELTDSKIASAELQAAGTRSKVATGSEAEAFLHAFLAGTFSEDNPQNFGPTPAISIRFVFQGHDPVSVGQWPDKRFELRSAGR